MFVIVRMLTIKLDGCVLIEAAFMCYHLCCSRIGTVGVNVQKTVLSMQRVTLNMCSGGECESECVNESLCVCVGVCATSCSPATASCFKARRASFFWKDPAGG